MKDDHTKSKPIEDSCALVTQVRQRDSVVRMLKMLAGIAKSAHFIIVLLFVVQ